MRQLGLIEIERLNAITLKRIKVIEQLQDRVERPPNPRVGTWRHEFNLESLRFQITLLEKKRMLYLGSLVRGAL